MMIYVCHLPTATPPHVITPNVDQVNAWLADGIATAVYELDAVQTYPAPEPPVEGPETPEEPPA